MEIHTIFRNSHVIWKFTCYLEIHTIFPPVDENSYLFADKNYTITFDCRDICETCKVIYTHITSTCILYNLHVIKNLSDSPCNWQKISYFLVTSTYPNVGHHLLTRLFQVLSNYLQSKFAISLKIRCRFCMEDIEILLY